MDFLHGGFAAVLAGCRSSPAGKRSQPNCLVIVILEDTIAAISTPIGEGGLAVVRISGPQALQVADR